MQYHRIYILTFFLLCLFSNLGSTQNIWSDQPSSERFQKNQTVENLPSAFRLLTLNDFELNRQIKLANRAKTGLQIPLPNGKFDYFSIQRVAVLHPDLAKKFPNTQTFSGRSLRNPTSTMRMVWNGVEFHAIIFTQEGIVMIDKINNGNKSEYLNYFEKEANHPPYVCGTETENRRAIDPAFEKKVQRKIASLEASTANARNSPMAVGTQLKTYRLAMATSGELTTSLGGVGPAMTRVINLVSDLNAIFEREFSIRLELIPTNETLIFPDPATDPYTNGGLDAYLDENVDFMNETVGVANFDVGHVINPLNGGVAYVGVFCNSYKAGGTSSNDLFVLAHEIGHQMDALHTFNYCNGEGAGGYEPGSGNTLMSYSGLCPSSNMPGGDLLQYHAHSYQEIIAHLYFGGGNSCGTNQNTGNLPPNVSVPDSGFTIPISTPFTLKGSATDDDGSESLTYLWEQYDRGGSSPPQNPKGTAPIFRSFPYSNSPERTFPELSKIINGTTDVGETLPTYSRDLNFRLMVHDNHAGGGGVDFAQVEFHVDENAGPFEVQIPNDNNTVWSAGQMRSVYWEVANTDIAPVSCATVDILASFDGGFSYPDTLAKGVSNDGEQVITVPNTVAQNVRIKVAAADNIFFDISDENFEIFPADTDDFILETTPSNQLFCSANIATFQIDLIALGIYNTPVNLSLSGLPSGVTSDLPASVLATSITTLTLGNLAALNEGNYVMTLTATEDGGALTKTKDLQLIIRGMPNTTSGNALNLDGDDYVTVPDTGNLYQFGAKQNFSIEGWFNTTYASNNGTIIAKRDSRQSRGEGWSVYMRFGAIHFAMGDGNDRLIKGSVNNTFNDGEWHHFAVSVDRSGGGKFQIYVDGHLEWEQNNIQY